MILCAKVKKHRSVVANLVVRGNRVRKRTLMTVRFQAMKFLLKLQLFADISVLDWIEDSCSWRLTLPRLDLLQVPRCAMHRIDVKPLKNPSLSKQSLKMQPAKKIIDSQHSFLGFSTSRCSYLHLFFDFGVCFCKLGICIFKFVSKF